MTGELFEAIRNKNIKKVRRLLKTLPEEEINQQDSNNKTPFYLACWDGHTEIVKLMMENSDKIDINKPDNSNWTPFFVACFSGRTEIVKLMMENDKVDLKKANNDGWTPFCVACFSGRTEIVKLMMKNSDKMDLHKMDNDGNTPFFVACFSGHIEIVKLMMASDNKIDINKPNIRNETPLSIAATRMAAGPVGEKHTEIVKILTDALSKSNAKVTAFTSESAAKAADALSKLTTTQSQALPSLSKFLAILERQFSNQMQQLNSLTNHVDFEYLTGLKKKYKKPGSKSTTNLRGAQSSKDKPVNKTGH